MSKITISSLEDQIKEHQTALGELQAQLEKAKSESPDKQLAKELHSMLCNANHIDGCGWEYEDWSGHAHSRYLAKAQKLIHRCNSEGISVDTAIDMFNIVKGY